LPEDLVQAIASWIPEARETAISRLEKLLTGRHRGLELAARTALAALADDDSRRVSVAAQRCLATHPLLGGNASHRSRESEDVERKRAEEEALRKQAQEQALREAQEREEALRKQAQEQALREAQEREEALRKQAQEQALREAEARKDIERTQAELEVASGLRGWFHRTTMAIPLLAASVLILIPAILFIALHKNRSGEQTGAGSQPSVPTHPASGGSGLQAEQSSPAPGTLAPKKAEQSGNSTAPAVIAPALKKAGVKPARNASQANGESGPLDLLRGIPRFSPPKKVAVSSGVMAGNILVKTAPVYPAVAKAAKIQGTVVLQATISRTGSIVGLAVVSGPPLLQQAAMDAVGSWKYKPYLLNGEPVEVGTQVNIVFSLSE